MDSDSDDSYAGETIVEGMDDIQMAKDHKKTIVDKINVEEEEDVDEDFVFS